MEDEAIHKLNPIVPAPLTPWQTSQGFMASIQGMETELGRRLSGLFAGLGIRRETKYTLMVVDPGYFNLHALYIDIPVGADGIFDYMQGKVRSFLDSIIEMLTSEESLGFSLPL